MPRFLKGARAPGKGLNPPKTKRWKQNVKNTRNQNKKRKMGGGGH